MSASNHLIAEYTVLAGDKSLQETSQERHVVSGVNVPALRSQPTICNVSSLAVSFRLPRNTCIVLPCLYLLFLSDAVLDLSFHLSLSPILTSSLLLSLS